MSGDATPVPAFAASPLRRALDVLYGASALLAGLAMVATLVAILVGIGARWIGADVPGTDAYAGYAMAAAGFLALAPTLRRGEHIRVTLIVGRLRGAAGRALDVAAHAAGLVLAASLAWFSWRLVLQSREFNDVSQSLDATPMWIPQLAMAVGASIFVVAVVDALVDALHGRVAAPPEEAARIE